MTTIFKSIYGEALLGFPYTENSIMTIVTEENSENNKYHSLEWSTNYFFDLLLNQVPRAINLLFITPDYWLIPKDKTFSGVEIWERLRIHRAAFVTERYAQTANDTINLYIDRCVRMTITSSNSTMLDLALILFAQEILANVINTRFVCYPLLPILREVEDCRNKNEMVSKIIGRQIIVDNLVATGNLQKEVSGFTKNQIKKLRKEVLTYDG